MIYQESLTNFRLGPALISIEYSLYKNSK